MNTRGLLVLVIGSTNFLTFIYSIIVALHFMQENFVLFMGFTYLSGSLPTLIIIITGIYYYRYLSRFYDKNSIDNSVITSKDYAEKLGISLKRFHVLTVPYIFAFAILSVLPGLIYHHYIHPLKPVEALAMAIIAYVNAFIFAVFITYIEFSGKWIELL